MERRFGNYILHERVGIGGMGEVYRATKLGDDGFKVQVALKIILPDLARDKTFTERFSREARLAAALQHPNIVQVFDFKIVDDTPFIEMEFLPGTDLRRVLQAIPSGERLSLEEAVFILHSVARGLDHAHSHGTEKGGGGVIHCDLNPHNILISILGQVKVTDFGIARALLGDAAQSSTIRGKLAYMSPEQIQGRELDRQTDLFSLGIIAYQLFAGEHPFERHSEGATIAAIGKAEYAPLRKALPGLPLEIYDLVDRLLALEPGKRPERTDSVLQILEPHLHPSAGTTLAQRAGNLSPAAVDTAGTAQLTAPTVQQAGASRLWPYVAVGILSIVLVAVVFLLPTGLEPARSQKPEQGKPEQVHGPVPSGDTEKAPAIRTVVLLSEPVGARILAGGQPLGTTPVEIRSGPDGSTPPLEARLYGYRNRDFDIPSDVNGRFVITMAPLPTGTVRIGAIPWAKVKFRGEEMGFSPVVIPDVPVGKHTFLLSNDALGVVNELVVEVKEGMNTVSVEMGERP